MYQYKVLVVGNAEVGKTTIIQRLVQNRFVQEYKATIGVDFSVKNVNIAFEGASYRLKFQLWDISGQERYNRMSRSYYKNADACYVVVDLAASDVLGQAQPWLESIVQSGLDVPVIVLLNKCDLPDAVRNAQDGEMAERVKKLDVPCALTVSALTGKNLQEAIEVMGELLLSRNNRNGAVVMGQETIVPSVDPKTAVQAQGGGRSKPSCC